MKQTKIPEPLDGSGIFIVITKTLPQQFYGTLRF